MWKERLRKFLPLLTVAALVGSAGAVGYHHFTGGECCAPGAACCKPGAPRCAQHQHAAR